jgi:hypothetical protein
VIFTEINDKFHGRDTFWIQIVRIIKPEAVILPVFYLILIRLFLANRRRSTSAASRVSTATYGNALSGISVFIHFTGISPCALTVVLTIVRVASHMTAIYAAAQNRR